MCLCLTDVVVRNLNSTCPTSPKATLPHLLPANSFPHPQLGIHVFPTNLTQRTTVRALTHLVHTLPSPSRPSSSRQQAYMCLTDVVVRDFNSTCLRSPHPSVLTSPAFKYLQNMEEKICHIEVGERRGGERGGGRLAREG